MIPNLASFCRILEEEDDLVAAHRWQIEETMAIVRQEMTLLGQVLRLALDCLPIPPTAPCALLHGLFMSTARLESR